MDDIKIIGPMLATALQITVRFVAGRRVEKKNYLELFTEIPMNIVFLATSFLLIHLFTHDMTDKNALILFIISLIASMIVMLIYRECKDILDADETKKRILAYCLLILLSYGASLYCIYEASLKFGEKQNEVKTEINESKTIK